MDQVIRYYQGTLEVGRVERGRDQLEFVRMQELVRRFAPGLPARVLDVGGGSGAHAAWLTEDGYEVDLVDPVPEHIAAARALSAGLEPGFTATVGDARALEVPDDSYDLVLLFGPLYHLMDREDRLTAWSEAARVAKPDGTMLAVVFSRWAGLLDEVFAPPAQPAPGFVPITDFTSLDEAIAEAAVAGVTVVTALGVDGPGWLVSDFDARWADADARAALIEAAQATEQVPELMGLHAHWMIVAEPGPG